MVGPIFFATCLLDEGAGYEPVVHLLYLVADEGDEVGDMSL